MKSIVLFIVASLWAAHSITFTKDPIENAVESPPHKIFNRWETHELLPGGRFDAVAYLDRDIVVVGSRGKGRGHLFRSEDLGKTWKKISNVTQDEITCLANGGDGIAYMLTGNANFYRSEDYGKSWQWLTKISNNKNTQGYTLSYGIIVSDHGTVLVSDTESSGGHVYRSADKGTTWTDLGPISDRPLYRFQRTGNSILVNGWACNIYRSQDDGISGKQTQHLCDTPLYATEYLGAHVTLQASEDGHIFRSQNYGETWTDLGKLTEAADDFVKLGTGAALLTTYREKRNMYVTLDYGKTWENIGPVNKEGAEDWFDPVYLSQDKNVTEKEKIESEMNWETMLKALKTILEEKMNA